MYDHHFCFILNRRCIRDNPEFLVNQDYCIEGCEQHTFCGEVVIPDEHLEVNSFLFCINYFCQSFNDKLLLLLMIRIVSYVMNMVEIVYEKKHRAQIIH